MADPRRFDAGGRWHVLTDGLEKLAGEPVRRPGSEPDAASAAHNPRKLPPTDVSWSGVNMTPKVDSATSKLPSAKGSASASATRKVTGKR
jgi:hypothetical protein